MSELHKKAIQGSPYPETLDRLVQGLEYRPGWLFRLAHIDRGQGSEGLTLVVTSEGYDTYHPERGETYRVNHYMPVPPAAYDERSWKLWLLDQLILIERHEACEFLKIEDERPFAPHHGPGNDPYAIFVHGTDLDVRTRYTGEVAE